MAKLPSKSPRDHRPEDFEGLLNNLQDWEFSFKEKDKKLNLGPTGKEKMTSRTSKADRLLHITKIDEKKTVEKIPSDRQFDFLKSYDTLSHLSSGFQSDEGSIDANSERELGNEFFKQKKFNEAIDCYSRSLALSPTAVAYANRAMAYIKIKRFQEAENDCTEALNLDDRYVKAYSRRATARKELLKFKDSLDDTEFALRLEPQNQEIKKQYAEAKSLFQNETRKKAIEASTEPKSKVDKNLSVKQKLPSARILVENLDNDKDDNRKISREKLNEIKGHTMKSNRPGSDAVSGTAKSILQRKYKNGKEELEVSVQELAARAANLAKAEAARNIVPPKSAYEFEFMWRGLSGDRDLQSCLLKVIAPTALPGIFKNALSAPILIDIIGCIASFFTEDTALAVDYLLNLTKIPRFDMIIMCLSSTDKADLLKIWDQVFRQAAPDHVETLDHLRSRYAILQ